MDRKLSQKQEIERLIHLAEISRTYLADDARAMAERLNVVSRVRTSLKTHPKSWLFGGVASGFVTSMIFRRRPVAASPKPAKSRNLALTLLGLTLTAIRPLAKVWLTDQLGNYLAGRPGVLQPKNSHKAHPSSTTL